MVSRKKFYVPVLVLLCCVVVGVLCLALHLRGGAENPDRGVLNGTIQVICMVIDDEAESRIPNAAISLDGQTPEVTRAQEDITNASTFYFENIPAGDHVWTVEAEEYEPASYAWKLEDTGQTWLATFFMSKTKRLGSGMDGVQAPAHRFKPGSPRLLSDQTALQEAIAAYRAKPSVLDDAYPETAGILEFQWGNVQVEPQWTVNSIQSYVGSELMRDKGLWLDDLLENFVVLRAAYDVSYDEAVAPYMASGTYVTLAFMLRDPDTGDWEQFDGMNIESPPLPVLD